ncbi:hypothetical protein S40293_04532 [Stachybotrys chartarum IBT 40293]|nr:hypothetical protein S40293_04532 [Stachybotrys chartarum IBT 40293]
MEPPPLPPPSQASSHFPLEPIPASVLAEAERKRRDALDELGRCSTGCAELDDHVLLGGGFERGCVVGLSAEEEDVGVLIGLQTLARALCQAPGQRALLVTPRPANMILAALRDALRAEARARRVAPDAAAGVVADCLDRTMLSCVFDLDGLWEVLAELDRAPEGPESPCSEIQDSQDEGGLSPLGTESSTEPKPSSPTKPASTLPHLLVVTHFSALLTSLFTHRDKAAAHTALQLLGSHLRYLSRHLASSPLVIIVNSTTTSSSFASENNNNNNNNSSNASAGDAAPTHRAPPPLEPTLRSIFNPPPLAAPGYPADPRAARRNKPSFGQVFAQLLDLHLLATRVPRAREDADADAGRGRFVTVVEVLLDEMGLWEGRLGPRRSREQRWGAVCVKDGRIVDAFDTSQMKSAGGTIRLVAGFGGPRV